MTLGHTWWGDWKPNKFCSGDDFVNSVDARIETPQGSGDDTALNAVGFGCKKGDSLVSSYGYWGHWSGVQTCPDGSLATSIMWRSERRLDSGDDTAANGIKLGCRYPDDNRWAGWTRNADGYWGDWERADCPSGQFIAGYQIQIESPQGSSDDTAANKIRVYCKKYQETCASINIRINNHQIVSTSQPAAASAVSQSMNNCKGGTEITSTLQTSIQKKVKTTNTWTLSKTLSKTFAKSYSKELGSSVAVSVSCKPWGIGVGVSTTFSSKFTWSGSQASRNTWTNTKTTTHETTTVNTFESGASIPVAPYTRKMVKVLIYKTKGFVNWQGQAQCLDKQGNLLEEHPVNGTWSGAGISTGNYMFIDEPCDSDESSESDDSSQKSKQKEAMEKLPQEMYPTYSSTSPPENH